MTSLKSWQSVLLQPRDISGLAAFRVLFGFLMLVSITRFWTYGWVERFFIEPMFHFKYWGFSWIASPSPWMVYALFSGLTVAAILVLFGLFYRAAILFFFFGFTYVQLIDAANYLNHYYLISLLALLMCFLPMAGHYSLDAALRPKVRRPAVPLWCYSLLRLQVGIVYVCAGLAKWNSDWLLHAQPLNLWMMARVDTPVIGDLLDQVWVHYGMSWAGFLFDTTIPFWLLWKRTRVPAYIVCVIFHSLTAVFFPIGMFPWIMIAAATIFFPPTWARGFLSTVFDPAIGQRGLSRRPFRLQKAWLGLAVLWMGLQVLLPLRHTLYPNWVLWSEEGMRFSWKVMVREKNSAVTFRVTQSETGRTWQVSPGRYLNRDQEREMGGQPELILQLAQHIAKDFQQRGLGPVEVRVDAWCALNGRRAKRLIDPKVDLVQVKDMLASKRWVLPFGLEEPLQLGRR